MEFLVPDYYSTFKCKASLCRNSCCEGWPVTFSMGDYFRLLSIDISPATKECLDRALHLTAHPTEDEYAMILPRYDGKCPMHTRNGLCSIQAELNEDALPAVCRLYPRGIRKGEASCTNSCEAVIELLCRTEPLHFQRVAMTTSLKTAPRSYFFESCGRELEIRLWLIDIVQDRRFSLARRLRCLERAVHRIDEALTAKQTPQIGLLLSEKDIPISAVMPSKPKALQIICAVLERLDERSDNIKEYGKLALSRFMKDENHTQNRTQFLSTCPCWESWFENMLVNHMFFSQFPFQDRPVSLRDEVPALFSIYALLRFLMIGAGDGTMERLINIAAALFRLVDHTAFDRYVAVIFKEICKPEDTVHLLAV